MRICLSAALLVIGACSPAEPEPVVPTEPAITFEMAAKCKARLTAVARLFSVLASEEGENSEQMMATARNREASAAEYDNLARKLAADGGQSDADISAALEAADAAIQAEYDKRPFEDFAVWVGSQADECPPPG